MRLPLGIAFLIVAAVALPQSRKREKQDAPEGEGRTLLVEACVQCHDLGTVAAQRKTLAGWKRTVNEMIWKGAPLMADEVETLARYLATSFGPTAKPGGATR